MNPARQRILQYLMAHEIGMVKEIKKCLPDIPGTSKYRYIKILADHSVITVVRENRIRGTVESVYRLKQSALEIDDAEGLGYRCHSWEAAPLLQNILRKVT